MPLAIRGPHDLSIHDGQTLNAAQTMHMAYSRRTSMHRDALSPRLSLLHIEFLGVFVKHELIARDERNVQQAPSANETLAWDALDQGVTFELRSPDGQKLLAL